MGQEVDQLRSRLIGLEEEYTEIQARLDEPLISFTPQRSNDTIRIGVVVRDIDTVRQQIARAEDDERRSQEQVSVIKETTLEKLSQDETAFWFRRFFTTLGIAHAAAFVALTSGFLQSADKAPIGRSVADALTLFATGMIAAGLIPLLLWGNGFAGRGRPFIQRLLVGLIAFAALLASGTFVFGIMKAVGAVRGLSA